MNILVVDPQGILNQKQSRYARNRLYFALVRFEHRINGVTLHFSTGHHEKEFRCKINANIEGCGVISVKKTADDLNDLINSVVNAIEPKVALRVDWRSWLNPETLSTFFTRVNDALTSIVMAKRPSRREA